ncbi:MULTISPECIES: DUF5676 family membrane protein [Stenotrophomonas]|uniref:DUF5676 family membrane protein n=1 Tax=Stenotrophomonas TaxID=40323 RepID=UPI000A70CB7F|nr:DUF5676 family membrane protein [Stenotrophomonas sp. Ste96]
MNRLNPITTGLSLAITVGLLYLMCALVVAFAPGAFMAALGLVAHSLNLAPLMQQVAPMSLTAVLVGLLVIMAYSFIAGLLFGLVNNAFARSRNR